MNRERSPHPRRWAAIKRRARDKFFENPVDLPASAEEAAGDLDFVAWLLELAFLPAHNVDAWRREIKGLPADEIAGELSLHFEAAASALRAEAFNGLSATPPKLLRHMLTGKGEPRPEAYEWIVEQLGRTLGNSPDEREGPQTGRSDRKTEPNPSNLENGPNLTVFDGGNRQAG